MRTNFFQIEKTENLKSGQDFLSKSGKTRIKSFKLKFNCDGGEAFKRTRKADKGNATYE